MPTIELPLPEFIAFTAGVLVFGMVLGVTLVPWLTDRLYELRHALDGD